MPELPCLPSAEEQEARRAEYRARIKGLCQEMEFSAAQRRYLVAYLVDGQRTAKAIRSNLPEPPEQRPRSCDIQRDLSSALATLAGLPEFWAVVNHWRAAMIQCAANQGMYDERPPGVRGVTEHAAAFEGYHGPAVVPKELSRNPQRTVRIWADEKYTAPAVL